MKVAFLFIDTNYSPSAFVGRDRFVETIGIEYLCSIVNSQGYQAKIIYQDGFSNQGLLKEILDFNPDIVGFSVFAYNFNYSKKLAELIKINNPKVSIIFGGPFPSSNPEIVTDESIDYVVIGEGEDTLCNLIRQIECEKNINDIKGIACYNDGVKITLPQPRIKNLDKLPWPVRSPELLKKCRSIAIAYPPPELQKGMAYVTYSRGCSYACVYCDSSHTWGEKTVWREASSVVAEMQYLEKNYGINLVGFTDLTFNVNHKKVYELCGQLIKQKNTTNWLCGCRVDNIDEKLLKAMKDAGCTRINYGIESISNSTLSKIGRKNKAEIIKTNLQRTHSLGILIRGYLMIGYPWETKDDILTMARLIKDFAIDDLRITFFTPFPGTPLWKEYKRKGMLLTENFDYYTTDTPIVKVPGLSSQSLLALREKIFREFYQSREYEQRMKDKIRKYPHLKHSYDEFFEFLNSKDVLGKG